jgi:hypothetical protein
LVEDDSGYGFDGLGDITGADLYDAIAFSRDGRYLFILCRYNSHLSTELWVVDTTGGVVLQKVPLGPALSADEVSTGPGGARRACTRAERPIMVGMKGLTACSFGQLFAFDVAPPDLVIPHYVDAVTRGQRVMGAKRIDSGSIAYWTETNKVFRCSPECIPIADENRMREVIGGNEDVLALRVENEHPGEPSFVLTSTGERRWRCDLAFRHCEPTSGEALQPTPMASATNGTRIEAGASGLAVVARPDGSIHAPFGEPFVFAGARATAAALTPSGSVAVIALERERGSLLAIGSYDWLTGMNWHALETVGRVLEARIDDPGDVIETVEDWHAALITKTYRLSGFSRRSIVDR